jgi:hypothetical protein
MAQTKNLPQTTSSSSLSVALQINNKELAIREVSALSVRKILDARELRQDLEFELEQTRKNWRWYKNTTFEDKEHEKDKKKHMAELEKKGNTLKMLLAKVPDYPTLFEWRSKNEKTLVDTLTLMIIDLTEYHNTTDRMGANMTKEVALRVALQFGGLTIEDVALCFNQVKNGLMGKVYNRVDASVIMGWLHEYQKDVQEIGADRQAQMHVQAKGSTWKNSRDYRISQIKDLL